MILVPTGDGGLAIVAELGSLGGVEVASLDGGEEVESSVRSVRVDGDGSPEPHPVTRTHSSVTSGTARMRVWSTGAPMVRL
jgi:hypothetical protein